jgi:hypothetical protein
MSHEQKKHFQSHIIVSKPRYSHDLRVPVNLDGFELHQDSPAFPLFDINPSERDLHDHNDEVQIPVNPA